MVLDPFLGFGTTAVAVKMLGHRVVGIVRANYSPEEAADVGKIQSWRSERLQQPTGGKPAIYVHRNGMPYEGIRRRGPEG